MPNLLLFAFNDFIWYDNIEFETKVDPPVVPSSRARFYASVAVESKVRCLVFNKVFQNRSKSISDDFTMFFSILTLIYRYFAEKHDF